MKSFRFMTFGLALVAASALLDVLSPGPVLAQVPEGTGYLSALPDFPLMPGLQEQPESSVVFDKPSGRIVEATLSGEVLPAEVRDYYSAALPPLGWQILSQADDSLVYRREEERLVLMIASEGGRTLVRLALEPIG